MSIVSQQNQKEMPSPFTRNPLPSIRIAREEFKTTGSYLPLIPVALWMRVCKLEPWLHFHSKWVGQCLGPSSPQRNRSTYTRTCVGHLGPQSPLAPTPPPHRNSSWFTVTLQPTRGHRAPTRKLPGDCKHFWLIKQ